MTPKPPRPRSARNVPLQAAGEADQALGDCWIALAEAKLLSNKRIHGAIIYYQNMLHYCLLQPMIVYYAELLFFVVDVA